MKEDYCNEHLTWLSVSWISEDFCHFWQIKGISFCLKFNVVRSLWHMYSYPHWRTRLRNFLVLTVDLKKLQGNTTLIWKIESPNHPKVASRMRSPAKKNRGSKQETCVELENCNMTQKCSKNFLSSRLITRWNWRECVGYHVKYTESNQYWVAWSQNKN